jgi:hypothetical protein
MSMHMQFPYTQNVKIWMMDGVGALLLNSMLPLVRRSQVAISACCIVSHEGASEQKSR